MSKVSVIGVGNVGATCANVLAGWNIAKEIVLLDVREGYAEGKAIDIQQSAKIMGINSKITGVTNDYKATAGSDVVVVTSGMPRKPGMSREDLIGTNAKIVSEVVGNIVKFSPNAFIVMVSNPMDTAYKTCNIKKNHLIGMGGALDSSRFNYYLSKALNAPVCDIDGMVIGAHGDATMVPLMSSVKYKGGDVEKRRGEDPQQSQERAGNRRHNGRRRHNHQTHGYICILRSRRMCCKHRKGHTPRREENHPLQCSSERRIRRRGHLPWSTHCSRTQRCREDRENQAI